ncbi:exonuclease SbcC [Hypnocyclicus thermotrophus]|uniref:Exonuclease SbcC n=1 Tax=Hypnocyclicus thermotrophus TaxID=1627895 RepID=A0AA46DWZ8_9FUSO|nr:SMC family ATPase [Hypnocyclicus thermotrophus]TDT67372.1 exonuclease SbcC [Hypnocyclicus thermotrophus]
MKINKIYLENYRIHDKKEINFSNGVNLLLGKNGAGKSSILEAIGHTLFSSKLRDNSAKNCIKYGRNKAIVEIEFEGNDGIEYVIKKTIKVVGNDTYSFYEKNNPEKSVATRKEIDEKIYKICGLIKQSNNIYDNIVSIKQNSFVDIFLLKPSDREKMFNEIFNTEIYREMFEKYLKEVKDEYDRKKIDIEMELKLLNENNIDINKVNLDMKNEKEVNKNLLEKEKKIRIKKDELKKEKEKLLELENEIKLIKSSIENIDSFINNIENQIKSQEKEFEIIKKAKVLLKENEKEYNEYNKNKKELGELEEKLKNYEEIKSWCEKQEKIKEKIKLEIEEKNWKIGNIKTKQENINNRVQEIKDDLIKIKNELSKKQIQEQEILKNIENKEKEKKKIKKLYDEYEKLKEEKRFLEKSLEEIKEKFSIDKQEIIEKNLNQYEKEKKKFLELKKEKEKLKNKEINIRLLIDQNKKAEEQLSTGFCPILQENCKNIEGNSPNNYFINKSKELKKEYELIINKLNKYNNVEIKLNEIEKEINLNKEKIKEFNIKKNEKHGKKLLIKELELELEKKYIQVRDILKLEKNENIKEVVSKLEKEYITLQNKQENLNIKKDIEIKKELELKLKNKELENKELENEAKILSEEIKRKQTRLKELTKQLSIGADKLKNLNPYKDKYDDLKEKNKELENKKNIYIENKKTADNYDSCLDKLEKLKQEKEVKSEEKNTKNKKKIELKKKISEIDKEKLEKEIVEIEEYIIDINEKIGISNTMIKTLKEKEEEYNKNIKEIKKLEKRLNKIKLKSNIADDFRKNINNMGKMVSKYLIEDISIKATENFREITGRTEIIKWINDENNTYQVLLKDEEGTRVFEQLSGGEQIAVALAIRTALAEILSSTNFIIFDEPTNNLDEERRKSLADSMSKILSSINQSIIVTHDDTFEEMANKIIYI